eukprot:m51a1_g608 putative methyltransferase domain containing protein (228) ;mRNA; f:88208-88891
MESSGERTGELQTPDVERDNVHAVYDAIADQFSATRHKAWPATHAFLASLPAHSLVADVGCGNGKYLPSSAASASLSVGFERCAALAGICCRRGFECCVSDNACLPVRSGAFDAVVSVAVLHHFSTRKRRVRALAELARITRSGGCLLVSVWAAEQARFAGEQSQDVMVPWKYVPPSDTSCVRAVYQRYYHLFREGELAEIASEVAGLRVDKCLWEADNWYIVARKV